jgi:hypothetical protein
LGTVPDVSNDPASPEFDPDTETVEVMLAKKIEADAFFEAWNERSWDRAELGQLPAPAPGLLSPETAVRYPVGSLVRFTEDYTTDPGGVTVFGQGEIGRVVKHALSPNGVVTITVRGSERRSLTLFNDDRIETAAPD